MIAYLFALGEFIAEIADPAVHNVSLKIPNWGWLMVNNQRNISIVFDKKLITEKTFSFFSMLSTYFRSFLETYTYAVGNPAFEFVVRSYEDNKVTFESRKFVNSFLSVNQSGEVSVQVMSPHSSEVQFFVRVQVNNHMYSMIQNDYNSLYSCMDFNKSSNVL